MKGVSKKIICLLTLMLWGSLCPVLVRAVAPNDLMRHDWKLSASRLILEEGQNSATLWLTNTSDRPWFVSGAVFVMDAYGLAPDEAVPSSLLIVSPPAATVSPGKRFPVKLVWIGDKTDWERRTEKLERLRLRLLPGKTADTSSENSAELQIAATVWVKVYLRPKALITEDIVTHRVEVTCHPDTVALKNTSPYWVTLISLEVGDKELIDANALAPMVPPRRQIDVKADAPLMCHQPISAKEVSDTGYAVDLDVVSQGEK